MPFCGFPVVIGKPANQKFVHTTGKYFRDCMLITGWVWLKSPAFSLHFMGIQMLAMTLWTTTIAMAITIMTMMSARLFLT